VEHKAQTHFENFLHSSRLLSAKESDAPLYFIRGRVRHIATAMYSASMSRPKPHHIACSAILLGRNQGKRVVTLQPQLSSMSDNDVFGPRRRSGNHSTRNLEHLVSITVGNSCKQSLLEASEPGDGKPVSSHLDQMFLKIRTYLSPMSPIRSCRNQRSGSQRAVVELHISRGA